MLASERGRSRAGLSGAAGVAEGQHMRHVLTSRLYSSRIVAEERNNARHHLFRRPVNPALPVADAVPRNTHFVSGLLLVEAEFEATFFEVLTDGLWVHLGTAFQDPPMVGNMGSSSSNFQLVEGQYMDGNWLNWYPPRGVAAGADAWLARPLRLWRPPQPGKPSDCLPCWLETPPQADSVPETACGLPRLGLTAMNQWTPRQRMGKHATFSKQDYSRFQQRISGNFTSPEQP